VIDAENENGGTTLRLRFLNGIGQAPIGSIKRPRAIAEYRAVMDDRGNLYILAMDRIVGYNPALYIVAPNGALKEIAIRKSLSLHLLYSLHGKVMVATDNFLDIIEDSSVRTIRFRDIGTNILIEGREGEVIALGTEAVDDNGKPYSYLERSGKPFAQAVVIDLDSGQVTEKLLPAPQTEEDGQDASGKWLTVPGVRYGYTTFVGASPDLRRLNYVYSRVEGAGDNDFYNTLGVFDTEKEQDLPVVNDECCPPEEGYLQYRDYLMVSHFPEAGGSALLVNMKDLSPVVDFHELLKKDGSPGFRMVDVTDLRVYSGSLRYIPNRLRIPMLNHAKSQRARKMKEPVGYCWFFLLENTLS
jgi:hypothetical protein